MLKKRENGFTLPELLIAAVVFVLTFVGILLSYLRCMELNEMSKHSLTAVAAVKTKMEEIKNTDFNDIFADYDDQTFTANGINGKGVIYIDDSNSDLLKITIPFCWKQTSGIIVGEDENLNGQLDSGEDKNGNGMIDSIVEAVSYVYNTQ